MRLNDPTVETSKSLTVEMLTTQRHLKFRQFVHNSTQQFEEEGGNESIHTRFDNMRDLAHQSTTLSSTKSIPHRRRHAIFLRLCRRRHRCRRRRDYRRHRAITEHV